MTRPTVLELTTLEPERPLIRIDKDFYELALIGDLGLSAQARLARLLEETTELQRDIDQATEARTTRKPTGHADVDEILARSIPEELAKRLEIVLDEALEVVFLRPLPTDVVGRLDQGQKREILAAFKRSVETAATPKPETSRPTTRRSTSASSSRGSRRPTATVRG